MEIVSSNNKDDRDHQRWLDGIVPLQDGARLRGCSVSTLKREGAKGRITLIKVSERRWGIKRRDALAPLKSGRRP